MPRRPSRPRIPNRCTKVAYRRWGSVLVVVVLLITAAEPALTIGAETDSPASPDEAIHSRTPHPPPALGPNRVPMVETHSEQNDTRRVVLGQRATATVFFNCTEFRLEMTPADRDYYLVLAYLDTTTETRYRFMVGPMNGHVRDPYGETEFLLLEVEIRVPRAPSVAVHLPRRCLDTTSAVQSSRIQ